MSEWIDVTTPLTPGTVGWPGDRRFEVTRESSIDAGDDCTVTSFAMSAHLGTHIDAPLHYFQNGGSMDRLPFDAVIGRARVIEIAATRITAAELERHAIQPGERVLFKTANSKRMWFHQPFFDDYVHITRDGAICLAESRPALIGVDYLSVGAPGEEGADVHRTLLKAGIWIVEALNLTAAPPGNYDLFCLPLRIVDAEGAPARAVLRTA